MSQIDDIVKVANDFYNHAMSLEKFSIIRKLPDGKYIVMSQTGKNLGTYSSKDKAKKRLKQVEYFKHKDQSSANDSSIDLTKAEEFSYSSIMRQLRKNASKEQVIYFLQLFKHHFDKSVKNKLQSPEKIALQNAMIQFAKKHTVNLNQDIIKNAAMTELGDPISVGKYLADMIRFIMVRISPDSRQKAFDTVKRKIYYLHENDISNKNLPASSAMGQSITLVKNVLFNHNPSYIRAVINNLVRNL